MQRPNCSPASCRDTAWRSTAKATTSGHSTGITTRPNRPSCSIPTTTPSSPTRLTRATRFHPRSKETDCTGWAATTRERAAFLHYYDRSDLKYNLCVAITAEEENSGSGGLESIIPDLGPLEFAIVGEPTLMQLAIAERGLMVIDCTAHGKAGHAAREEGDNAIYKAMRDIEWFRTYRFPKESNLFGAVKMSVTIISAGSQHNVVPAQCRFTVDIRVTDRYTNEEVLEIIREHVQCEVTPRSTRLKPSSIPPSHPIVQAGLALGRTTYGSPTTSDQALLDIPSLKLGVGDSARSHSADEFVHLSEIREGIELYIEMLKAVL